MKFDFFKSRKTRETNLEPITNSMPPEIYRGVQTYESESDRFCSFDEDYFFGEEYDLNTIHHKKRISIREPKISPTSFFGFFCGAFLVLIISGGIIFFSSFSRSGGIYHTVIIPSTVGLKESEALSILSDSKESIEYSIEYKENPNVPEGTVISQIPAPNTERKLYGLGNKITVRLTVSKATEEITLPNLAGQNARNVMLELRNAGINVKTEEIYSDTADTGKIISTSLPVGSKLKKNDSLILTVSKGKYISLLPVPDLLGKPEATAEATLKRHGFKLGSVTYKSSEKPIGTVISQSIEAGTSLRENSKISVTVSKGK